MAALFCAVAPRPVEAALPPRLTDADVAPISWGKGDARARSLASMGRCLEASALVDDGTPEQRLAKAWLLDCARDAAGVAAATEGLAAALPAARIVAIRLRAEALLTLGRPEEALTALGDSLAPEAHRLRARALRESGALADAFAGYEVLITSDAKEDRALGLLGMARLALDVAERGLTGSGASPTVPHAPANLADLEARLRKLEAPWPSEGQPPREKGASGLVVDALLLLRRLDAQQPQHWAAQAGRKLAADVVKTHSGFARFFVTRTPEERIFRAERLLEVHRNEDAVSTLTSLSGVKLPADLRCRHLATLGKAHKKLRQWTLAKSVLGEAAPACREAKSELAPTALFHWAAALERLDFDKEAAAAYASMADLHPESTLVDDSAFFLVRHLLDDKKDWRAARKLAEHLVESHPNGDLVGEAVFFVAARAMVEERWRDAEAVLKLNDKLPPPNFTDHDAGRTEYWKARVAAELRAPKATVAEGYRSVFRAMPMGWYSLLAYARLREMDAKSAKATVLEALGPSPSAPALPAATGPTFAFDVPKDFEPAALETALLLARLGLSTPAEDAMRQATRTETPETLWFSAWVLDRAGAHRYSHDILRRKLKNFRTFPATGPQRRVWELAYPTPFRDAVTEAAKDSAMPPAYLWAIMREESGFNPGVESSANAMGLMQLILPTAKRMAKKEEGPITPAALMDPRLSVTLGARYLAHVLKRAGGAAALPILPAGYNAGEGALERWLKARGELPLDLFVETMTFEEARWYTKRVVSSYATYRFLYFGGETDKDPLPYFPQRLPR